MPAARAASTTRPPGGTTKACRMPSRTATAKVPAGAVPTSPGAGADVAIEAADVTLVKGELTKVVEAIQLSKATFAKIVQNLFWAWFYNVAAIPIAALGLLHPMIGVVAMTLSSLSVIGNSLLLKRVRLGVAR